MVLHSILQTAELDLQAEIGAKIGSDAKEKFFSGFWGVER